MMESFLDMGGYAAFVWPAYVLVAGVLAVLLVASRRFAKAAEDELAGMEIPGRKTTDET